MVWSEQWGAIGKTALDAENTRSPVRMSGTGKRTGGVPISRGHLYWILSNPSAALTGRRQDAGSVVRIPALRPLHLMVRETEFCGLRLAGDFSRRTSENGGNSVRRPRHASLTDRNCEGFCRPGNRVGLPVLYGGRSARRVNADSGSSRTQLIHPTPSGAANPPCRPRKALSPRFGLSISWAGKRNFVGRDWRAISGAECGRTAGIRFADRESPH